MNAIMRGVATPWRMLGLAIMVIAFEDHHGPLETPQPVLEVRRFDRRALVGPARPSGPATSFSPRSSTGA